MFSDKSHFEVNGHRSQYVRRRVGEALNSFHIQHDPKHPPKKIQNILRRRCFGDGLHLMELEGYARLKK